MATLAVLRTVLLLRILVLLALAASIIVMALNHVENEFRSKAYFYDIIAYRYVVAVAGVGFVYTLIQIPFAIYNVVKEKRFTKSSSLQQFDFYGDKVIAFLLAAGVGVGFSVTYELKGTPFEILILGDNQKKFTNMAYISTGILALAFILSALLSVISSVRLSASANKLGFFK